MSRSSLYTAEDRTDPGMFRIDKGQIVPLNLLTVSWYHRARHLRVEANPGRRWRAGPRSIDRCDQPDDRSVVPAKAGTHIPHRQVGPRELGRDRGIRRRLSARTCVFTNRQKYRYVSSQSSLHIASCVRPPDRGVPRKTSLPVPAFLRQAKALSRLALGDLARGNVEVSFLSRVQDLHGLRRHSLEVYNRNT